MNMPSMFYHHRDLV